MLTEGWDCNTVTHIIGIRPFMSQLLCEQVVGRGLRRASYEVGEDGRFTEEVSKVLGVPFEVIPFKATSRGPSAPRVKRYHVHPIPEKRSSKFISRVLRIHASDTQSSHDGLDQGAEADTATGPDPPEVEVKRTKRK